MESTITETEAQEIRDLMRNCALEAAVGYATGLAHATGQDVREVMSTNEYRAYSFALKLSYVGMAWRLPEFSNESRWELQEAAMAARAVFYQTVTGRELVDDGLM